MKTRTVFLAVATFLTLSLLFAVTTVDTYAQVTTATFYGHVVDPSGGAIQRAQIQLTNQGTGVARSTASDDRGDFTFTFVPVGRYTIEIDMAGFKKYRTMNFDLNAGQDVRANFILEVAQLRETVTVTSEAPLLNAVNAQQNVTLTENTVRELPVVQRDITNILNLATGVTGGSALSLNGLPPHGFVFTMDGVHANPDPELPSIGMYGDFNIVKGISLEAVQEVQTAKNIFSAAVANTVGGNVNVITKSGTNKLHGGTFWNYQAGGLNARNQFISTKAPLVFHQFGGSVGGPIIQNKMFFFAAYEGYRLTAMQTITGNVPTKELRDLATAAIPASKAWWDTYPLPTGSTPAGADVGFFSGTGARKMDDNHAVMRWDWNMTPTSHANVRYTRFRPNTLEPRINFANSRTYVGMNDNISASYTRGSSSWSSETRFGFNRADMDRIDNLFTIKMPAMYIQGLSTVDSRLFGKYGNTWTVEEIIALTRGRHSIKTGGIFQFPSAARVSDGSPYYQYLNRKDLLANNAYQAFFRFVKAANAMTSWQIGGFVLDDWKLSPKLVLNLGLRYDYYSVMRVENNATFNRPGPYATSYLPPDSQWNADYNNFAPRLGLAWTLDESGKTVVRSGYGIFFSRQNFFSGPVEITRDARDIPLSIWLSTNELTKLGVRYPDGPEKIAAFAADPNYYGGGAVVDPNWRNPYSQQWTLGIQRQLTDTVVFETAYVGSHGVKLIFGPTANRVDRQTGARPYPNIAQNFYYQSADSSVYNSIQTSLRKRFAHNLSLDFNYTYASNLSYYDGDMAGGGSSEEPQEYSVDSSTGRIVNDMGKNRGPTPFFVRHRFTADWIYELPFTKSSGSGGRVVDALGRGWQVGGVFVAQSGESLLITQGSALPGSRPDFVGSSLQAAITNAGLQYLNPAAFGKVAIVNASKATARPGTLGRRALFGPGFWNTDLSLSKKLQVKEGLKTQLRVDMFNAFNMTNFYGVSSNVNSSNFGVFTSTRGARVVQLNLRIDF